MCVGVVTVLLLILGQWLLYSRMFQILRCVCIIIGGMQTFISYINCYTHTYILLTIYLKLYKTVYILHYVGNNWVGTCCMLKNSVSSTLHLCVNTCNCYIYIAIYVSHVAPIRNRLCTRGGGVEGLQQSGPPSKSHSTTTERNVTEATIELSQRKSSDTES